MRRLTEKQKLFIIEHLACYDSPSQVVAAFKEEFGLDVERSHVGMYDPRRGNVSERLRVHFEKARAAFLADVTAIPISNASVRLNERWKLYRGLTAGPRPNAVLANEILNDAARDFGGSFTHRREITGLGGSPLVPPSAPAQDLKRLSLPQLMLFGYLTALAEGADAADLEGYRQGPDAELVRQFEATGHIALPGVEGAGHGGT